MAYVAYIRKSRADAEAEQHGEGETFARHERTLVKLAQSRGLPLSAIYKELVSGETIAARPIMQKLLHEVEAGLWTGVLVVEVERLARGDTMDQGMVQKTFLYSGTRIVTPMKTYDPANEFDQEYFEFGLFMSRREYQTIRRRLQAGRLASVGEGKYCGNTPPYGYVRQKLTDEKGWTLAPHPKQADTVRTIFRIYNDEENHIGIQQVANRLNAEEISTSTGVPWTAATVSGILHNCIYAGFVVWGRRATVHSMENGIVHSSRPCAKEYTQTQGRHEALITREIFDRTQNRLQMHKTVSSKRENVNPLAGLIFCGICGRRMQRRPYSNHAPVLLCPRVGCGTVSSDLGVVESAIVEGLRQWAEPIQQPANDWTAGELLLQRARLVRLDSARHTAQARCRRACELVEQGVYTKELFLARQSQNNAHLDALARDAEDAYSRIRALEEQPIYQSPQLQIASIYALAENARQKGELLSLAFDRITYYKTQGGRWNTESDLKLVFYPRFATRADIMDSDMGQTNSPIWK